MTVSVFLHDDLGRLTASHRRRPNPLRLESTRRASIKDFLEALGVPHTEIYRLTSNGREVDFSALVNRADQIEAYGPTGVVDPTQPSRLRPEPLPALRFAVDANVGRLAGLLRLAGFDTFFDPRLADPALAARAAREQRFLLTRDLALLKRREVRFGRLVRAEAPHGQLAEIARLFGLAGKLAPFSRCLRCNGVLAPVTKAEILDRLEPLTKEYYQEFKRCPGCLRIYWAGSHQEKMSQTLEKFR